MSFLLTGLRETQHESTGLSGWNQKDWSNWHRSQKRQTTLEHFIIRFNRGAEPDRLSVHVRHNRKSNNISSSCHKSFLDWSALRAFWNAKRHLINLNKRQTQVSFASTNWGDNNQSVQNPNRVWNHHRAMQRQPRFQNITGMENT